MEPERLRSTLIRTLSPVDIDLLEIPKTLVLNTEDLHI
jgi:hypothetical protein